MTWRYGFENQHGMNWEHGENRSLKEQDEQVYDVWRRPPLHTYNTPHVYNVSNKSWNNWNTRLVKGVYKCFADYLFLILGEKITAKGEGVDTVFEPAVEVFSSLSPSLFSFSFSSLAL